MKRISLGKMFPKIYFTQREAECAKLLIGHAGPKEIADTLGLSRRTVEHYLRQMKNKLHCKTLRELAMKVELSDLGKRTREAEEEIDLLSRTNLFNTFMLVSSHSEHMLNNYLVKYDIDYIRFLVLNSLEMSDVIMSVKDISSQTGIETDDLVKIINQMEKLGLIKKRYSSEKKYTFYVQLTSTGKKRFRLAKYVFYEFIRITMKYLDETEIQITKEVFEKIKMQLRFALSDNTKI